MRIIGRLGGIVVLVLAALAAPAGAGTPEAIPGPWVRPVPGPVTRAFVAPAHPYGPGHRGVDLATQAGEPVRAAGSGTVSFAGTVAGTRHVVVRHSNGLRTGYSFLGSITVTPGAIVEAGTVLGGSGGSAGPDDPAHDGSVLHFSLRRGDLYLDPMALLAPVDLGAVVHLAPPDGG